MRGDADLEPLLQRQDKHACNRMNEEISGDVLKEKRPMLKLCKDPRLLAGMCP
jgi:hypothetical protein